jgi:hypothetical protein
MHISDVGMFRNYLIASDIARGCFMLRWREDVDQMGNSVMRNIYQLARSDYTMHTSILSCKFISR